MDFKGCVGVDGMMRRVWTWCCLALCTTAMFGCTRLGEGLENEASAIPAGDQPVTGIGRYDADALRASLQGRWVCAKNGGGASCGDSISKRSRRWR